MKEIIDFLAGNKLDFYKASELYYTYRTKELNKNNDHRFLSPQKVILMLELMVGMPQSNREAVNKDKSKFFSMEQIENFAKTKSTVKPKPVESFSIKKETKTEFSDFPPEIQRIKVEMANLINQREGMKLAICEMPEDNRTPAIVESRRLIGEDIDELTAKIDVLAKQLEVYNKTGEIKEPEAETEKETAQEIANEFASYSEEKILVELNKIRSLISMTKSKIKKSDGKAKNDAENRLIEHEARKTALENALKEKKS